MDEGTSAISFPPGSLWWIGLGAVLLVLLGMLRWRSMVLPFFVILYIEGFFRNLLDTPAVLLVKDVLLAGIYAGFLLYALKHRRWLTLPASLGLPLMCFFTLSVLQMFNPALESLAIGLVGLKTYFYYVPLMFVIPAMLRTDRDLYRFLTALLLLGTPIAAYGIIQYLQGPEAYAALGPAFRRATFVIVGEYYEGTVLFRPNATFSWPSHYATFLHFSLLLSIGLMHLRGSTRTRRIALLALPVFVTAVILSGQRALYLLLPVAILFMLITARATIHVINAVVGLAAVGMAVSVFAPPAILGRFATFFTESNGGLVSSRFQAAWNNLTRAMFTSPMGHGTGISALGSRYLSTDNFIFTESYFARIVNELGIFGLVFFFWLYVALIFYSWRVLRRTRDRHLRYLAAMVLAYLAGSFLGIYGSNSLDLAISAVSFWLMLGIARTLVGLDIPSADLAGYMKIARRPDSKPRMPVPALLGTSQHR